MVGPNRIVAFGCSGDFLFSRAEQGIFSPSFWGLLSLTLTFGADELLCLRFQDAFKDLLDGASELVVDPVRHLVPVKLDLEGIIVLGHGRPPDAGCLFTNSIVEAVAS